MKRCSSADSDLRFRNPDHVSKTLSVPTPDGARLRVQIYGPDEADTIVFAHGISCRLEYWNPQINAMRERFRVVVYDQRGHGRSELGTTKLGTDVLADDLHEVLKATVNPGKAAVLVGHSMGGITIMAWAQRYPDSVREYASKVILASTTTGGLAGVPGIPPILRSQPLLPIGLYLFSRFMPRTRLLHGAFRCIAQTLDAAPSTVEFGATMVLDCDRQARAQWIWSLRHCDVSRGLQHLRVPTTVIGGCEDKLVSPRRNELIANDIARNGYLERHISIPDAGHCVNLEAIDEFNGALLHVIIGAGGAAAS